MKKLSLMLLKNFSSEGVSIGLLLSDLSIFWFAFLSFFYRFSFSPMSVAYWLHSVMKSSSVALSTSVGCLALIGL